MVVDFNDIKDRVKGWVDQELDHKMILRHDDPLARVARGARRADLHPRQQSDRRADCAPDLRRLAPAWFGRSPRNRMGNSNVVGHVRRLIVFDLDGTLIDSRQDLVDSANALIEERGGAALPADAIARMVGEGAVTLVRRALAAANLPPNAADVERFLRLYDDRLLRTTRPYRGYHASSRNWPARPCSVC